MPAVNHAEVPVSCGQEALYYLQQLVPGSWAYNVPFAGRTRRRLEAAAMRRASERLVARHPTLGMLYGMRGGRVVGLRSLRPAVDFGVMEDRGVGGEEAATLVRRECRRPFDLHRGPMLRVRLVTGPGGSVLFFLTHHVAVDLWSCELVVLDLLALYEEEAGGAAAPAGPEADYDEFVRWQHELVAGAEGARQYAYWQAELGADAALLNLQLTPPPAVRRPHAGAAEVFRVPAPTSEALRDMARREGTTLFRILLAAYATLLFRHTGQQEVLIGTPFAGRPAERYHRVVGDFVNLLPIRVDFDGRPSFREVMARVDPRVRGAMAHQDYPFPLLVKRLGFKALPGRTPLLQTTFALFRTHRLPGLDAFYLQDTTTGTLRVGGFEFTPLGLGHQQGQFDLALEMAPRPDGLWGAFKYDTNLLDEEGARRLADRFCALLASIVATPEAPVSVLSVRGSVAEEAAAAAAGPA